ncbi:hypothetical protein C8R45DRAFT_935536 [Mycena sanguinolenta]|nr:hypothetical protein C8R45DRAFT_935536 [Mycena sanguinolenta]
MSCTITSRHRIGRNTEIFGAAFVPLKNDSVLAEYPNIHVLSYGQRFERMSASVPAAQCTSVTPDEQGNRISQQAEERGGIVEGARRDINVHAIAKSRIKWHENDGRAPDTHKRLAAVQKLEAEFAARNAALTDEERWFACNSAPVQSSALVLPQKFTTPTDLRRQSYVWSANSCFVDAPMEVYFRAFISMSTAVQAEFLRRIRTATPDAGLQYWVNGTGTSKPDKKKLMDAEVACQLNMVHRSALEGGATQWQLWMVLSAYKKYFGVLHVVNYSGKAGHALTFPLITIEPGVYFNDLLLGQQFVILDSPAPLLDNYLMHIRTDEALALRLMGEIRVGWSFAKSEKHTTHTQHTQCSKDDFLSLLDAVCDPETKRNCFAKGSKDFNSRKVEVLVSKSEIMRAETVNRNCFITPSRGFSRVPDMIRLLKNLPVKVNHSKKRDSDPLASLGLLQALYTVQRY